MEVWGVTGAKIPVKNWASNLEPLAFVQAENLSRLPFAFHHVALMPDAHCGYGMPIGGVLATRGVIIPNAVGVDIGCGMCAVKTNLLDISATVLKTAMSIIREKVPLGFGHHKEDQEWDGFSTAPKIPVIDRQLLSAKKQLGTLGGGNHFIEIQKGDDGFIWVMIHSGSRNFGYQIAKEYNATAQHLCKRWHSNIPEFKGEDGLAFLPIEDPAGKEYYEAMKFALEFAKENRKRMMNAVLDSIQDVYNGEVKVDFNLDIHHNYASWENHFGENVLVHRKGATAAYEGQLGIIPGSQGTSSYIVEGLGNSESFKSCSHGAGRIMSRSAAIKNLDLEAEKKKLDDKGIIHAIRSQQDLEEASGAYKDIDEVMENQKDLVKIKVKLSPLAVIKG